MALPLAGMGSTFLPAGEDFVGGALYYGIKMADVLRAFSLGKARRGKTFYVSDEAPGKKHMWHEVKTDGVVDEESSLQIRAGESVAGWAGWPSQSRRWTDLYLSPDGRLRRRSMCLSGRSACVWGEGCERGYPCTDIHFDSAVDLGDVHMKRTIDFARRTRCGKPGRDFLFLLRRVDEDQCSPPLIKFV